MTSSTADLVRRVNDEFDQMQASSEPEKSTKQGDLVKRKGRITDYWISGHDGTFQRKAVNIRFQPNEWESTVTLTATYTGSRTGNQSVENLQKLVVAAKEVGSELEVVYGFSRNSQSKLTRTLQLIMPQTEIAGLEKQVVLVKGIERGDSITAVPASYFPDKIMQR